MSINQISPVSSTPPSQSLSVSDSQTREVSSAEVSEFEKSLEADKPDFSKATVADVQKFQTQGLLTDIIIQGAEQRQQLAAAIEGRDPE